MAWLWVQRTSAALVRQRWRCSPSSASASLSSGNVSQRRTSSSWNDRSAPDGWLSASAQNYRRIPHEKITYPARSTDRSSARCFVSCAASPTLLLQTAELLHPPLRSAPFSTTADDEDEDEERVEGGGDDGENEDPQIESVADKEKLGAFVGSKKPSVLDELPQPFDPVAAYDCLTAHHPEGSAVSLRDFRRLCLSARPGRGRDAKKIAQALRDFKRRNLFCVDSAGCRLAMEGMVRARTPVFRDVVATPEQKAEAVLWALWNGWLDVKGTGIYYAYPTKGVDHWLETLLHCVRESEGRIRLPDSFDHTTDLWPKRKGEEEVGDGEREDVSSLLPVRLLGTVQRTVHLLIRRGSHPDRLMKKRKARKYRKALRMTAEEGNASPLSVHLGVQIALELGGTSKCARDCALTKFREKRNKHMEMEETGRLVGEKRREESAAKRRKLAQAKAEEAAAKAEAEAVAQAEADAAAGGDEGKEDDSGDDGGATEDGERKD